jgi:hypothetical protein
VLFLPLRKVAVFYYAIIGSIAKIKCSIYYYRAHRRRNAEIFL